MRKILVSFLFGIIFIFSSTAGIYASISEPVYDTQQLPFGVVKISYINVSDKKIKISVEKSGKKIYYNLNSAGVAENFPLQFGNGHYKITVYENITSDKYKYVSSKDVSLDISDDKLIYLSSIQNINWNGDMAAIKKARELTDHCVTDTEKINAIYRYIVENIKYDHQKMSTISSTYVPNIDGSYETGKGICYDFSSLFASMLRSLGLPTKLVKGYTNNAVGYHAWNEVYDSTTDSWIVIDTTFDSQMKASGATFSMNKDCDSYSKVHEY